jgi:hypothetical protein
VVSALGLPEGWIPWLQAYQYGEYPPWRHQIATSNRPQDATDLGVYDGSS